MTFAGGGCPRRSNTRGPRHRLLLAAVLSGLALPAGSFAQTPASVNVTVDATDPGTPLRPVWPFFGYDEINYTTAPDGQALLAALAARNAAPVHIRSHFLFNTGDGVPSLKWGSTNVYDEDAAGNPIYDWTITDGIFDALHGAGVLPLVELGFMPQAMTSGPPPYRNSSSTLLDGSSSYPPKDYGKWQELIRTWAAHARDRYPAVSESWLWELWNEPDIGYWRGTTDEYLTLYDHTEAGLHQALPDAKLGGPAVASPANGFLKSFLAHCATGTNSVTGGAGTRLDLISFHAKGGVSLVNDHVQMNLGGQLRIHRLGFAVVAGFPAYLQTPIYITEADPDGCAACPVAMYPADAYRNSPAYGAYALAMMKHTLELEAKVGVKLGGLLTWAFTFPGTPYFAGYRALTTNGVDLPVLGAFAMLGRLAGTRVPLTSDGALTVESVLGDALKSQDEVDGMATWDGHALRVLVWKYADDLVPTPTTQVHLAVEVPAALGAQVQLAHFRVDESHGDAYTTWVKQGSPAQPSARQKEALVRTMQPALIEPRRGVAVDPTGRVTLDFALPRFGASLVVLTAFGAQDEPPFGPEGTEASGPDDGGGCACGLIADVGAPWSGFAGGSVVLVTLLALRRRRDARSFRKRRQATDGAPHFCADAQNP